ncbi:hypothetical protein Droror1_Dr00015862 [Drosera rotundifolia]
MNTETAIRRWMLDIPSKVASTLPDRHKIGKDLKPNPKQRAVRDQMGIEHWGFEPGSGIELLSRYDDEVSRFVRWRSRVSKRSGFVGDKAGGRLKTRLWQIEPLNSSYSTSSPIFSIYWSSRGSDRLSCVWLVAWCSICWWCAVTAVRRRWLVAWCSICWWCAVRRRCPVVGGLVLDLLVVCCPPSVASGLRRFMVVDLEEHSWSPL